MHLYLTYKRYSSWSLRPWLVMKVFDIPFEESLLPFAHGDSLKQFANRHRIPATVPVLEENGHIIWDSLAIMEYLAEKHPAKNLWPANERLRAMARSASAEMHSGFVALRTEHPMNCHRIVPVAPSAAVAEDLKRLAQMWAVFAEIKKPVGDFLCGEFGIVDAMFAPVAWRVKGYALTVSEQFDQWSKAVMALPAMDEWVADGAQEEWRVAASEL